MSDWSGLLAGLAESPRENGTPSLASAASFVAEQLEAAGIRPRIQMFDAHPYDLVALGIGLFLLSAMYWWALRSSRPAGALVVALVLAGLPVANVDWQLPLTPGLRFPEANVIGSVSAVQPEQRLILAAHYDTKTDLADHVVRIPVQGFGAVLVLLAVASPIALLLFPSRGSVSRVSRIAGAGVLVYGVVLLALFSGGSLRPGRSHGALDDGAACAVLLRAAAVLSSGPSLERTEVVFVFFAAEEVGAQGSWGFVRDEFPKFEPRKTYVVNLDPIGASTDLTITLREGGLLRAYSPEPELLELLDAARRRQSGSPLGRTSGGGLTDAFPFLASRIAAATVISAVPPFVIPRGMHTPADVRSRIDLAAMDDALGFVLELVRSLDSELALPD